MSIFLCEEFLDVDHASLLAGSWFCFELAYFIIKSCENIYQ